MAVVGIRGHGYLNCDIRHVFDYSGTTIRDTGLGIAPLDSAYQIGLEIILNGILTALGRRGSGGDGSWHILGGVF